MTCSDHPQGDSNLWSGHHGRSHVKFKTFLHETDGSQTWQISGFWQEATNQKIKWFFYQVATCDKFMWQIISNLAPYLAPYRRDIWLPHLIRLWLRSHHSQSHITTKHKIICYYLKPFSLPQGLWPAVPTDLWLLLL